MEQNRFYLIEYASEISKITLSVIVYAPFLNKTTIKISKKQMNSSADTFFLKNPLPHLKSFATDNNCNFLHLSIQISRVQDSVHIRCSHNFITAGIIATSILLVLSHARLSANAKHNALVSCDKCCYTVFKSN